MSLSHHDASRMRLLRGPVLARRKLDGNLTESLPYRTISCSAFDASGRFLAVTGATGRLFYDTSRVFARNTDAKIAILDSRSLATICLSTIRCRHGQLRGHFWEENAAWSTDSRMIAVGKRGTAIPACLCVCRFDESARTVNAVCFHNATQCTAVSFTDGNTKVLAGEWEGATGLHDVETQERVAAFCVTEHTPVESISVSPLEPFVFANVTGTGIARRWDIRTKRLVWRARQRDTAIRGFHCTAYSNSGTFLAASGTRDGSVFVWDTRFSGGTSFASDETYYRHLRPNTTPFSDFVDLPPFPNVFAVGFSRDDNTLCATSQSFSRVWDWRNGGSIMSELSYHGLAPGLDLLPVSSCVHPYRSGTVCVTDKRIGCEMLLLDTNYRRPFSSQEEMTEWLND